MPSSTSSSRPMFGGGDGLTSPYLPIAVAKPIHVDTTSNDTKDRRLQDPSPTTVDPLRRPTTTTSSFANDTVMEDEDEVDTRDVTAVSASGPAQWSESSSRISAVALSPILRPNNYSKKSATTPKLTLSAFRRPEQTVRLTKSDPNRRLEAEYDLYASGCRVLGHGAFSTVRLAVRRCNGQQVAVKTIAKHEALRSRRLRIRGRHYLEEWEILRRLGNHPNIISLIDVFETNEEIQLVMEYCPGGELFDAIQKKRQHRCSGVSQTHSTARRCRGQHYTEAQAAHITEQILKALVDIHALGIVHRDVKAENILLVDDANDKLHVKLCDFGMARTLDDEATSATTAGESGNDGDLSPVTPRMMINRSYSIVGSSYYMAPEVGSGASYCASMDVYSLGVTLYILLCGFPPVFTDSDIPEVLFPSAYWKDISENAKELVRRMLDPEPSERVSAKEALKDTWLVQHAAASRPVVTCAAPSTTTGKDLDIIRQRLRASLETKKRRARSDSISSRKRMRRASSCLMALADLYRGMPAPLAVQARATIATTTSAAGAAAAAQENTATNKDLPKDGGRPELKGPPVPAVSV